MKCGFCGHKTLVTDSREAPSAEDWDSRRHKWLLQQGNSVFGWWSTDFRLRRRRCLSTDCGRKYTTIEITLLDLKNAIQDLCPTSGDFEKQGIVFMDRSEIEMLLGNLKYEKETRVLITLKTLAALANECKFRRERTRLLDIKHNPS